MKVFIVLPGLIMLITFSCKSVMENKSGKELVTENCISCHNYSEARSMYNPSIFGMKEKGVAFKKIYENMLNDTNHLNISRDLTSKDKDNLYRFIMSQERSAEDLKY